MDQVTLVELRMDVYMEQAVKSLANTGFMESPSRIIVYHDREEMVECVRKAAENKESIKTLDTEGDN